MVGILPVGALDSAVVVLLAGRGVIVAVLGVAQYSEANDVFASMLCALLQANDVFASILCAFIENVRISRSQTCQICILAHRLCVLLACMCAYRVVRWWSGHCWQVLLRGCCGDCGRAGSCAASWLSFCLHWSFSADAAMNRLHSELPLCSKALGVPAMFSFCVVQHTFGVGSKFSSKFGICTKVHP